MQVYKKILVAADCSSVDEPVIEHVARLALQNHAEVVLLRVVHSHTLDQDRALRNEAESHLEAYRRRLDARGVAVDVHIRAGEPADEVLAEIAENDYDLVAMGTHGHGFFADILFGSVSDTLKHKIDVPLLLLKGGTDSVAKT